MTARELAERSSRGLVARAYQFARKAHTGQKRLSGETYFSHVESVADQLAAWHLDEDGVAAGLLHDVVEDTPHTLDDIEREFGAMVRSLVDGVTKIGHIKYRGKEEQKENLRKLMLALGEDIRVILIKLADRQHNMRTLSFLPREKQERIALETAEIYAPLAYRLGMQHLAGELEDLAFPYLHPKEHAWLLNNTRTRYEERERYLEKIKPVVASALARARVRIEKIEFRVKRYASLYKKLVQNEMDVARIYDLIAFRIIVPDLKDCYTALGVIHELWPPLPGRIKDYIAMPKPNGYRSLHTTVFCEDETVVEFQVRTGEMHREAEDGIAAHFTYKERKRAKDSLKARQEEVEWVQRLREWQEEPENKKDKQFIEAMKIDFFKDRIFALTTKGEVIDLPAGATPVDFAYRIHTNVGDECVGARANDRPVPLDYELRSGDVVKILTQKNKRPSLDWITFVKSPSVKRHIRGTLRKSGLLARKIRRTEFLVSAIDRIGLLRDVSSTISRTRTNIVSTSSGPDRRRETHLIKVRCDVDDEVKIARIAARLKAVKGVIRVEARFV
ncbi:MAG: RelA/SpoT family protein [Candidatus Colwellbacteria bacterium]|nr:RelA/SpoT family protein [Candidatus Colwellbacteria bacterium]